MAVTNLFPQSTSDEERRLADFSLASTDFHTAFRPGLGRAIDRSTLAPPNAAGTDLYNDTFELLAQILVARKWRRVLVMGQPRLIHPEGKIQLALSSAHDVADVDHRVKPKTRHKGPATFRSLDQSGAETQPPLGLPEFAHEESLPPVLAGAPMWFVLYERAGSHLSIALGRPAGVDAADRVVDWSDMIAITPLEGTGDLGVFDFGNDDDFDVPVEPRS